MRGKEQRRLSRLSARNRNTGGRCAGVLRRVAAEEPVDKDKLPPTLGRYCKGRGQACATMPMVVAWGVGLQSGGGAQQLKQGSIQRLGEAATSYEVECVRLHTGGRRTGVPGRGAAEEPVGEKEAPSNAVERLQRRTGLNARNRTWAVSVLWSGGGARST